jgi:hypothetical protein
MNLKYFSGIILICLSVNTMPSFAQKPETVYSIAHVVKPIEFYIEQIGLWKKELDKDKTNPTAWFNYYKANRYAHISSGHDSVYASNRFQRIQAVVKEMEANIPNTFEAHFIKWANGYNDWNLLPELQKAYEMDSTRIETYDGFINLYEANRDMVKRDYFLKKWYQTGLVSPGLLNYNYNVLKSLKPNAILITAGDNDTYFAWMVQAVLGIRKDVTIINVGLASMKDYAARLSAELGVNLPNTEDEKYEVYTQHFYKALVNNKFKRPVYAGLTVGDEFTKPVESNLYLIGLAYEYSDEKMDNIAILKKNLEKEYALDYLDASFGIDTYETVVACANSNYVVPMLTLYNHYKLSDDMERANYWKEKAKKVAKKGGKEEEMKNYFKE